MTPEQKAHLVEKHRRVPQEIVEAIRQCSAAGMSTGELTVKFSLTKSVITNIIHKHTYYVKPKRLERK